MVNGITVYVPHMTAGSCIKNLPGLEDRSITFHENLTSVTQSLVRELDRVIGHNPIVQERWRGVFKVKSDALAVARTLHPQYTIETTRKQEKIQALVTWMFPQVRGLKRNQG